MEDEGEGGISMLRGRKFFNSHFPSERSRGSVRNRESRKNGTNMFFRNRSICEKEELKKLKKNKNKKVVPSRRDRCPDSDRPSSVWCRTAAASLHPAGHRRQGWRLEQNAAASCYKPCITVRLFIYPWTNRN